MKVLTVINSLKMGGAEKVVAELLPFFIERDVSMDVLLLVGAETPLLLDLKSTVRGSVFYLIKDKSVYNPILILKIIKYLRKYEIVHVHLFPASYWVALAKMISFSKVKLIFTEHSTYNRRRNNLFFKLIDRIVYGMYSKIICISDLTYLNLKKHISIKENKIIIVNNGINMANISTSIAYDSKSIFGTDPIGTKYIIQVSSFRYPKDQETVIKALSLLPASYKLILIGDGVLREKCEQLCKNMELGNRIYFLGIRTDVYQFLKMSDVVVLSSYYEGLSLSSIEGMASGNPFIATRVPGLEEAVSNAGLLFEAGDYKTLAAIIEQVTIDEIFREKIIKRCMERAKQYDIHNTVNSYIGVYENILHYSDRTFDPVAPLNK